MYETLWATLNKRWPLNKEENNGIGTVSVIPSIAVLLHIQVEGWSTNLSTSYQQVAGPPCNIRNHQVPAQTMTPLTTSIYATLRTSYTFTFRPPKKGWTGEPNKWRNLVYHDILQNHQLSNPFFLTGWWFQPLWKILVSWDDEIPNMEK